MVQDVGIGFVIAAGLMFASSRFGKFHARDRLLARLKLAETKPCSMSDAAGVSCSSVAMLLPRGRAVRIDLWSQVDQSNNSREATLRNAALEGVAERVSVHDGDMRKLPFADCTFDVAVAHFAIHNIPSRDGRPQAIISLGSGESVDLLTAAM